MNLNPSKCNKCGRMTGKTPHACVACPIESRVCEKCGGSGGREAFTLVRGRLSRCRRCAALKDRATRAHVTQKYPTKISRGYKLRNPEKNRAHKIVANELKRGRMQRKPCGECGNPKAQAHHDDYSKPLDIRWLCHRCHREEHRKYA